KHFLAESDDGRSIVLVNIESARSVVLFHSQPGVLLLSPRFSPDGQWITFLITHGIGSSGDVVVAPFSGLAPVPQKDWFTVASDNVLGGDVFWSPNGKLIYYAVTKAGRYAIKAQRLDNSRHSVGPPMDVYEFSGRVRPSRSDPLNRRL